VGVRGEEEADHGEAMTVRGTWMLGIDFSGHGTFAETGEDATSRVDKQDLTITIGRESQQTTGHSQTGSLAFALQNSDRALMPELSTSPLFGKVGPNKTVIFTGTAGAVTTTLLQGTLDSYQIDYGAVDYSFSATVLDGWGKPGTAKLSTPLYTGIRTGTAIGLILDAIGWTGARSIDPGATSMPYWWAEGIDAATAVNQLVDAEGLPAIAYVQGSTFYFRDRHHRILNTRSTTAQALVTQIYPSGALGTDLKIKTGSFQYDDGLTNIVNAVQFAVDLRQATPAQTVWSTDTPISLAAGDVQTVIAAATDPFFNATVAMSVRSGVVVATLDRDNGAAVSITLTASSASIIDSITLTGQSVPIARTVTITATDPSSVGNYGPQDWPAGAPPFVNQYDAQAIATRLVAIYAARRPSLTFTLDGYTPALLATLLQMQISDRITVRNDIGGINTDFVIERLVFQVKQLDMLELTIGCQVADPVQPTNIFQFDVAGHGFNQGLFGTEGLDSATTVFRFDTAGQGFNQGVFGT
jgi:hypothetical protein